MNIFTQLTVKPWEITGLPDRKTQASGKKPQSPKRVALKFFLGVVAVLFLLLIFAYAGRMGYEDWRPVPQIKLMWANSLVLLLAGMAFEVARFAARHGRQKMLRSGLLAAGLFTLSFLYGQFLAWQQMASLSYFQITNPAIAFFYLITGLHGLHLIGGLTVWGKTCVKVWGTFDPAKVLQSIELCTLYWHCLFLVWLVLFGLLFTGDNLDILLTICGIR